MLVEISGCSALAPAVHWDFFVWQETRVSASRPAPRQPSRGWWWERPRAPVASCAPHSNVSLGPQAEPSEEEWGSELCSAPDVALRAYVNHFRFNL